MNNFNSTSTEVLANKRKEAIKALFTRKTIVVNNRLLTLSDEDFLKEYDELYAKKKAIQYLTKDFNPDTDIIVPKAFIQNNLNSALPELSNKMDNLMNEVLTVKSAFPSLKPKSKVQTKDERREARYKELLITGK